MLAKSRMYLEDIRCSAEKIIKFVNGKNSDDYSADDLLESAVERQFEIIGEALNQLNKTDAETAQKMTDYKNIISFRNLLIHGYATVSSEVVWEIIEQSLPVLYTEVCGLLDNQ